MKSTKDAELTSPNNPVALNPLKLFPSRSDSFISTFLSVDKPKHKIKRENLNRWLHPELIDPEFGIKVIITIKSTDLYILILFIFLIT